VIPAETIDYLLDGDPAIRWQVMRDLLDAPESEWQAERRRVATQGWGARFLAAQGLDGQWPVARWTGTVWTLLQLIDLGMPSDHPSLDQAFDLIAARTLPKGTAIDAKALAAQVDLCHLGFWLRIGSYFGPRDERLDILFQCMLDTQMPDGGWNCRKRIDPKTHHSSFHTTFNVLDALREASDSGRFDRAVLTQARDRAVEFMLQHHLYRSDKTGNIVKSNFLHLAFPSHWHYTVLRGLDFIAATPHARDSRLTDPLDYIESRRKPNGRWPVEKRIAGVTLFDMEKLGGDSRWNTLRALRALRAAGRT
jgi:hypothetical protein